MKFLQTVLVLQLIFSGYVMAIVNGSAVGSGDWRSVVLLELVNPDNGQRTTCTGVIVSESYVITTASCVLDEESGRQVSKVKVCIGQKRPFKGNNQRCFHTDQIYSHHNFINNSGTSIANNLAYIKFKTALNLQLLKIKPAKPITPAEFSNLTIEAKLPKITWVGFDANSLRNPVLGIKQQGSVSSAEFDYQTLSIRVDSSQIRPGNHYQGMASFIQTEAGEWRLIGLISQSSPDKTVIYFPEVNPCDEDPILVRYPKPLMQASTLITAYPVAACGMVGFIAMHGYEELACKKLLRRNLDWAKAIERGNPTALRQRAFSIYKNNKSMDDAGEIYKLLYLAQRTGDKKASLMLAEFLIEGKLFARDTVAARGLIAELIEGNNPSANLLLAKMMLFPSDKTELKPSSELRDKKIFLLLESAANSGLSKAQYLLARLYQFGIGVSKNQVKAYHWYAQAAMQGHADGQYQLGMQWTDGRGVRSYPEVGLFWIQQAAAQGQLAAQNYLGLLKPLANQ